MSSLAPLFSFKIWGGFLFLFFSIEYFLFVSERGRVSRLSLSSRIQPIAGIFYAAGTAEFTTFGILFSLSKNVHI